MIIIDNKKIVNILNINHFFFTLNIPLMYVSQNFTINLTNMLIILIINIYYSLTRLFNCTIQNIYVYHAYNTHCTSLRLRIQVICD
jgi:hypothetical protein